jgi:glycine dehydrogenase subunit 1
MSDYIVHTPSDIKKMLKVCGITRLDGLFSAVPSGLRAPALKIQRGKSQLEVEEIFREYAGKNKVYKTILRGAGAYSHYIPPVVRTLSSREEFVTAYTPYQAEMSQGVLQSIFEFQTMIANLTGMDISNASMYDGATAAAEAAVMSLEKNRKKVIVSRYINPGTMSVLKTRLVPLGAEIVEAGSNGLTSVKDVQALLSRDVAAVYLEQPNFLGLIEDASGIGDILNGIQAAYIMGVNPIAAAILPSAGDCGADIAVGEGQPLGIPLSFGGPYLGFLAAKEKFMRKMPGRIVGETTDGEGRRAYVLTLQAREQHIRREKALSNICSNQALCALKASIYMAANGSEGMRDVAGHCLSKAHYAREKFIATGVMSSVYSGEFFHEFPLKCSVPADDILKALDKKGILGGLKLDDNTILWCVTEKVTKREIDKAAAIIGGLK